MEIERFRTVEGVIEKKININRSVFIATLSYVESEKEAKEFISTTTKKYQNATHNCPAYRVLENGNLVEFSSDDGEPSGTAGFPMLNTLKKNELVNVAVVVTRYFGGVKLGVRGLIDAYTQAVQIVIDSAKELSRIKVKKKAYKQKLKLDFLSYGKKMQQLSYLGVKILDISYTGEYACLEILHDSPINLFEVESTEVIYV